MTCNLKCPRPWSFYALNLLRWDLNIEFMLPVCVCCLSCLCIYWGGGKATAHSTTVWLSGPVSDPLLSVVYWVIFWLTHFIHNHLLLSVDGFSGCRPCAGCAWAVCRLCAGCLQAVFTPNLQADVPWACHSVTSWVACSDQASSHLFCGIRVFATLSMTLIFTCAKLSNVNNENVLFFSNILYLLETHFHSDILYCVCLSHLWNRYMYI